VYIYLRIPRTLDVKKHKRPKKKKERKKVATHNSTTIYLFNNTSKLGASQCKVVWVGR
jgi:hypothetical protein